MCPKETEIRQFVVLTFTSQARQNNFWLGNISISHFISNMPYINLITYVPHSNNIHSRNLITNTFKHWYFIRIIHYIWSIPGLLGQRYFKSYDCVKFFFFSLQPFCNICQNSRQSRIVFRLGICTPNFEISPSNMRFSHTRSIYHSIKPGAMFFFLLFFFKFSRVISVDRYPYKIT